MGALPVILAAIATSCGGGSGSASDGGDGGSGPPPCETDLADLCGSTCSADTGCPDGLYCNDDGECFADCTPDGGQCTSDEVCTSSGECAPRGDPIFGGLDAGMNDGGGGGGPLMDGCVDQDVGAEAQTPTVVLLVDQSSSMNEDFQGQSRWDALRDSLMDPQNGVVAQLENDVRFGLALYTSNDGDSGGQCPILTEVAVSIGNYDAINQVYQAADPVDETPTGESFELVAADLALFNQPGDKIIVVATDGEPDTCAEPNPQNGQPEAVAAVQNAFMNNIRTFVISVGSGVSDAHLQDLANAGLGNPLNTSMDAPFWVATNQQGLIDAFDTIISGVRSCIVDLDGEVDDAFASQGSVAFVDNDGTRTALAFEDPDGWQLNNPSQIELLGEACNTLKETTLTLSVRFPCGVVTPIPQ